MQVPLVNQVRMTMGAAQNDPPNTGQRQIYSKKLQGGHILNQLVMARFHATHLGLDTHPGVGHLKPSGSKSRRCPTQHPLHPRMPWYEKSEISSQFCCGAIPNTKKQRKYTTQSVPQHTNTQLPMCIHVQTAHFNHFCTALLK